MKTNFVQVPDTKGITQYINIRQIVDVAGLDPTSNHWTVYLTSGQTINLNPPEAEKLINRLPSVQPE